MRKKSINTLSSNRKTKERKRLLFNWRKYGPYIQKANLFNTLVQFSYIEKLIVIIYQIADQQKNNNNNNNKGWQTWRKGRPIMLLRLNYCRELFQLDKVVSQQKLHLEECVEKAAEE